MDPQRQHYLYTCESFLSNPANIEPRELAEYFCRHSHLGVDDYIVSLLERYFFVQLNNPDIMRYIHLLDRLIQKSFPLPQSFVNMFGECFRKAFQDRRKKPQEELKILRKIWTPLLNDALIEELRLNVFQKTRVDIETSLQEDSKRFLYNYFQKNMNLPENIIESILGLKPTARTPSPPREEPLIFNNPIPYEVQREDIYETMSRPKKMHKPAELSKKEEEKEKENENEEVSGKKEEDSKEKALLIYYKLRNFNNFCCKECGKYFITSSAYEAHKHEHFEERMKKFQEEKMHDNLKKMSKQKKGFKVEKTINEWLKSDQVDSEFLNETTKITENSSHKVCLFCKNKLEVTFIDDSFAFKGAVQVDFEGENDYIHTDCYQVLSSQE